MRRSGLSPDIQDQLAWDAIISWPRRTDRLRAWRRRGRIERHGMDMALVCRSLLWDKVGRAVRAASDPAEFASLERGLLAARYAGRETEWARFEAMAQGDEPTPPAVGECDSVRRSGRALVYVGVPTRVVRPYARAMMDDARFETLTPPVDEPGFEDIPKRDWPAHVPTPSPAFVRAMIDGMVEGLRCSGVELLPEDIRELRMEVWKEDRRAARIALELDETSPDALLLHADNHPPYIQYALAARARGIPSFLVQHGLDCERFFLDDAFASHLLVWSPARAARYRQDAARRPKHIEVIGYPGSEPAIIEPSALGRAKVVWVTRPHDTHKCLLASRRPGEGLAIFDALVSAIAEREDAELTIKPHPADYASLYAARIAALDDDLRPLVRLTSDPVDHVLNDATVVVSEDSTAGLDALLAGRRVVQAHLCPTPPVVPFAREGAALPGFTPAQLRASVVHLLDGRRGPRHEAVASFIQRFAGRTDGRCVERAVEAIAREISVRPTHHRSARAVSTGVS